MDFPHTWSYIHQRLHILNNIPTCGDTKPTDEAPDWKATGGRTREGSIQKGAFQISRNIASATKSDTATSNIAPATKNNRLEYGQATGESNVRRSEEDRALMHSIPGWKEKRRCKERFLPLVDMPPLDNWFMLFKYCKTCRHLIARMMRWENERQLSWIAFHLLLQFLLRSFPQEPKHCLPKYVCRLCSHEESNIIATSPNSVPAEKNDTAISPNFAPATKSIYLQHHSNFTEYCACHETCGCNSSKYCTRHEK